MPPPLVSIVINNFNYARYLRQAIDSAVGQEYAPVEVLVVDDGSTDGSVDILRSYDSRIRSIIKMNGGQASSLNVGFRESAGQFVCFLDSDDGLVSNALTRAIAETGGRRLAKVHWPLMEVDGGGRKTGGVRPSTALSEGNLRAAVIENGPEMITYPPTSGNLWSRSFLERVFPLPEVDGYRLGGADTYLSNLAPLYGDVGRVTEPLGYYRLHGNNGYSSLQFDAKLKQNLWGFEDGCRALAEHCRRAGIDPDVEAWKARSWLHRFVRARGELSAVIPPDATVVLVDGDGVGAEVVAAREVIPFREHHGAYWGPPEDDHDAICSLERLRQRDARFIIFAWPAFWWLDHYSGFRRELERRFRCVLRNDRLVVFDMRPESGLGVILAPCRP